MRRYQHHQLLVRNRQRDFSHTFTWFTRERRKSSGHKLILPLRVPLLSGSDAQALQFLKRFADEVHMADNVVKDPPSHLVLGSNTKQNVLQLYANIFEPGCGKPLGNPLHIEMDPSFTPVHAPRRRIPVSKLDKVNEELSRFCNNGTIKPVTQPADWLRTYW